MEEQKSAIKKFFFSKGFLIGGLIFLVILALAFGRAYIKYRIFITEYQEQQKEVDKLLNANGDLRVLLKRVQSPAYVEKIGRTNFNLVKPGENQLIIVGKDDEKDGQSEGDVVKSLKISNPRKWWNYFFNHSKNS